MIARTGVGAADHFVQPVHFCLCPLLIPLAALLAILNAFQEASEIALMFACSFMLRSFEFGILDVGTAVLAPVFWLSCQMSAVARIWMGRSAGVQVTVDFQYSDMSGQELLLDASSRNTNPPRLHLNDHLIWQRALSDRASAGFEQKFGSRFPRGI